MKAIYKQKDILCSVVEVYADHIKLDPITEDARPHDTFMVRLDDPNLIIDPTDDEVANTK